MTSVVPTPQPESTPSVEPSAVIDQDLIVQGLVVRGLVVPGVVGAAVVEAGVVEPVEVCEDVVSAVTAVAELRALVAGPVHGPSDVGAVTELAAAGRTGERAPLAVVGATASSDVAATVAWAGAHGVAVEVIADGDDGWSAGAVVVTLRRMDRVIVDPDTCTAFLGAGVTWRHLLHAAADVGVVGPVGADDDRGVVDTLLAGRRHADARVIGCTVITPDGRAVETRSPDGGIVTEMELELRA